MFPLVSDTARAWNEPWLFKLRTTTKTGWMLRGGFFVAVYAVLVVAMALETRPPLIVERGIVELSQLDERA